MSCTTLENPTETETKTQQPQPNGQATGPKTEAGKAQTRRNALKHGLSGNGVVLPSEMAERIEKRKIALRDLYHPEDEAQEWFFDRYCVESVMLDHCEHLKISAMNEVALHAIESWDDDCRLDAAILFDKLKKRPETVQKRLLQSKHGCDALIADWEEIARVLRKSDEALSDAVYQSRIFDLLGIAHDQRTQDWIDCVVTDNPLEWVGRQIEQLKRRQIDYLNDRDERDQAETQLGLRINAPSLRTILRYESAIQRRLQWALAELRALQAITSPPTEPGPAPAPEPQPEPRSESKPAPPPPPAPKAQATSMPKTFASLFGDRPAKAKPAPFVNDPNRPDRKAERRRRRQLGNG